MGWRSGLALAFALLAVARPGAAQVRVEIDLGAQVMRVAADSGAVIPVDGGLRRYQF